MSAVRTATPNAAETELGLQFAALGAADADRRQAFDAFAATGLPTRRNEAWHYTDLRSAMRRAATPARKPDAARLAVARAGLLDLKRIGGARFVLVDGHYVGELSDPAPAGARRGQLAKAPRSSVEDAAALLNDAFAPMGLDLVIDEGVAIESPIEIVHFTGGEGARSVYSHVSVIVGAGASVTILESFVGADAGCQRNALMAVSLGDRARCEFVGLVGDRAGLHVETQQASLGREAEFSGFALVTGGDLVRRQIFARHETPRVSISLSGLSLLDGARKADTTLEVTHASTNGKSREFFRHVVADEATGTFQGKVIVAPHAQKTDGGMKSQAILLSPTATMNNKPELEIFADDVVCGHGATVGSLDPEQLFYLQARGLPRAEAEAMLLEAFGAEAVERIADASVAEAVLELARDWFRGRGAL
jgi:Fe-S cluster assembly protein SufD